ncbi:hypothetical protein JCM1406_19360 [Clostridium novyi]
MYYLFKYKNIFPSEYYKCGIGEKQIIQAFIEQECKENEEENGGEYI